MKHTTVYWSILLSISFVATLIGQHVLRLNRISNYLQLENIWKLEFVFTAFILPIFLVLFYFLFYKKVASSKTQLIYTWVIIICITLSAYLDYMNWIDFGKKSLDAESRDVAFIGLILQYILALFIGLMSFSIFTLICNSKFHTKDVNIISENME